MSKRLIVVILIILGLSMAGVVNAESKNMYRTIEDKIDAEGSANVIIFVTPGTAPSMKSSSNNARILSESVNNKRELKHVNAYTGELTKNELKDLKRLREQGYDIRIFEDMIVKLDVTDVADQPVSIEPFPTESSPLESTSVPKVSIESIIEENPVEVALGISTVSIGANYSWNVLNITGRNITVAVIDSGIDYTHPDLGGCFNESGTCRVKDGYDFWNSDADPMDDHGHGTHVAGIIGANGSIKGVAPGVSFYALKTCDSSGFCNLSKMIWAVDWAIEHDADIISISIGGSFSDDILGNSGKYATSLAVDSAVDAGISVVVAAGNYGPAISTITIPGDSAKAITVGNIYDNGTFTQSDDAISSDSGRGPVGFGRLDPDIVAPGTGINSTVPNGSCELCNISRYKTASGTSMATPHVSGVIALMLEQSRNNGIDLTPADVRKIIMSSVVDVSGKVFDVGAGEINAINALTYNLSALVTGINSYGSYVANDRWEFISPLTDKESANITVYNTNTHNINFSIVVSEFQNMENSILLNNSQLEIPSNIVVNASSNYTFGINFSLTNFGAEYATTYGGKIILEGNDSKNLTIPVVITVPIKNYANLVRTLTNEGSSTGDVLYYAYYNLKPGNETIRIDWNTSSSDLDLYIYNSTADYDVSSGRGSTNNESATTNANTTIKWIRIHAYNFTSNPYNFTLNITDDGNVLPDITNVTNIDTVQDFSFSLGENITIVFTFTNPDNDSQTISLNDSRYSLLQSNEYNATYSLETNSSLQGTHSVRFTVQDEYGGVDYEDVSVSVYDIQIESYSPSNLTYFVRKNATANFTQISIDNNSNPLYYFWYLDGVLNDTEQNFSVDTTPLSNDSYNITFRVTNNQTNNTITWNLSIDQYGPTITIVRPSGTVNNSVVNISFTASDPFGVDSCWYKINNSDVNISIANCSNTSTLLQNGSYTLTIYSNDTYGFISQQNKNFSVNDTVAPVILSVNPSGDVDYDSSIDLTVVTNENSTCKYDENDTSYDNMDRNFRGNGTTKTKSYSVDENTNYILYVRCMDFSGNKNSQSSLINFTVGRESSSGGGSAGGTGYTPPVVPQTPSGATKYGRFFIDVKDNISLNINLNNISMKYLYAKIIGTQRNVDMSIIQHSMSNMPAAGKLFGADKIKYAFIEVKHAGLVNSNVEYSKLKFSVAKSWISENNIDSATLKIYRYNTTWGELPTTIYSQDSNNIVLESTSPGLSYFMVAGKQKVQTNQDVVNTTNATNQITGNQILQKKNTTGNNSVGIASSNSNNEVPNKNPLLLYWLIGVVCIIIVSVILIDVLIKNKSSVKIQKEDRINEIKKQYTFEGSLLIEEYNKRIESLGRDPRRQQKTALIKQEYDGKIKELHERYSKILQELK